MVIAFGRKVVRVLACSIALTQLYLNHACCQSRHINFEHLSVGNGLSNGEVRCIVEDRYGYLWIGTADGLNRYDGYDFRVFRNSRSDSTSLGDSHVNSLFVDHSGTLWVGTRQGGLCRYNAERMTFDRFTSKPDDTTTLGEGAVDGIYEDSSGTFWVITSDGGLNRFDPATGLSKRYHADPTNPHAPRSNNLGPIHDDGKGHLWIGSWAAGFHSFDLKSGIFEQYGQFSPKDTSGIRRIAGVMSIYPAPSGKLWLGTRSQLNIFDPVRKSFEMVLPDKRNPGLISRAVMAVLVDRFNTLWIGTYFDGLILVDLNQGIGESYVQYQYGRNRREEGWIPSSKINVIYEDTRGNVWVGTDDGILKASRNRNRFLHFRHMPLDPGSLPDDRIRSTIAGGGDSVWFATGGGGLVLLRLGTGSITQYKHDPADPTSIGGDLVNGIARGEDGSFWLALDGDGLNHFFPRSGKFVRFKGPQGWRPDLPTNWIFSVARSGDGRIWLGSNEGLIVFDPLRDKFEFPGGPVDYLIRTIHTMPDGSLWFGTDGKGLFRYDPVTNQSERFIRTTENAQTISNNIIRVLHEGSDGMLWIGTVGGGLNRFNPATREFRSFDEADGLSGDVVEGVVEDRRGTIWASTNKGLSRFDAATGRFRSYDAADGLPATRFQGSGALLGSGEIAFGTFSDGVVIFNPDNLVDNAVTPIVLVTGVRRYGSDVNILKGGPGSITFSNSGNDFLVEFVALDCTAPRKNRYAYQVEGLTHGWVDCGTRRSVEFTDVAPGEYILRVRGSNNDGVWGETSSPLHFTVLPPFWKTQWFLIAATLALTGGLYSLHRYRVSRLIEIERLRMRIAGDLHDDLGSNLSGIALMSDLAGRKAGSDEERERLEFIGRTARQMADAIKDLAWVVNPSNDTFDDLALRMKDTAAAMLAGIEHCFTLNQQQGLVVLPIEARRNVFLIYKEALHNIVRHSGATRVDIALEETGDTLRLTVFDNGRGVDTAGESSGSGLRNMRSRAQSLGGRIDIESDSGGGTRICLEVKIP